MAVEQGGGGLQMLAEMKNTIDEVQKKVEALTAKVREGEYQTRDGISYLDVKHFLLSSYCQHLVFLVLLKTEGQTLTGHPVIERLAEIRMFLEKIRPIDKKLQYQVDKLLKQATAPSSDQYLSTDKDDLKYKPNPDMLVSKLEDDAEELGGVYKPPKIAPTAMEEDERAKKTRQRAELQARRRASRSSYIKEMADDLEGRPEEIQQTYGPDSNEFKREVGRLEARAKQEEELFTRVPLSKLERKKLKQLRRSQTGLVGLMDDFDDDVAGLVEAEDGDSRGKSRVSGPKKRKLGKKGLGIRKSKGKFKKKRK